MDSLLPLGQAGPVSDATSAGATAAAASSAYSATWFGRNADYLSSTSSAGAQPWRQVTIGAAQGPSAGQIPVDQSAKFCVLIFLCPGLLDRSWLGYSPIPGQPSRLSVLHCCRACLRVLETLRCRFRSIMGLGRHVQQRKPPCRSPIKRCRSRLACGRLGKLMKVPPTTFAVMRGSDDVVLFGMATMKELGLDLYPWSLEKLRPRAVPVQTGVESPSFLAARLVTLSVQSK